MIGKERYRDIDDVTIDQHDSYTSSIEEHCPIATVA